MAKYGVQLNRTASATLALGAIEAPGSGMRRIKIYDFILGSEAAAADNPFLYTIGRTSAASSGGATVTPSPLDPADAASAAIAREAPTTNGTAGVNIMAVPLNQRATFRWVAGPGSELIIPATAAAGIDFNTPTSSAVAISGSVLFEEQ